MVTRQIVQVGKFSVENESIETENLVGYPQDVHLVCTFTGFSFPNHIMRGNCVKCVITSV